MGGDGGRWGAMRQKMAIFKGMHSLWDGTKIVYHKTLYRHGLHNVDILNDDGCVKLRGGTITTSMPMLINFNFHSCAMNTRLYSWKSFDKQNNSSCRAPIQKLGSWFQTHQDVKTICDTPPPPSTLTSFGIRGLNYFLPLCCTFLFRSVCCLS